MICVAGARTWKDNQGREIEAGFLAVDDGTVILVLGNGKEFNFPLDKLSPDDRKWVAANAQLQASYGFGATR